MLKHNRINQLAMMALILVIGLGIAMALPWLANAQNLSTQNEVSIPEQVPQVITRYYVAITGTGLAPTVDWSGAYTNVQDALAVAVDPSEIWVAKGIYYPDVGSGQVDNDRTSTFVMTDGVTLIGGFNFGDSDITDQNPKSNVTVLICISRYGLIIE